MAEGGGSVDNVNPGHPDRDRAGIDQMIGGGEWGGGPPDWANAFPGVIGMQLLDWLATQSWGDGRAARGSSNDFTEGGGASTGLNDDARGIENIINALLNRQNPTTPTPTPRVPRGGTEGGRRAGRGSMRSQYMPAYRGVSAGRGRSTGYNDFGRGGNSINNLVEGGGGPGNPGVYLPVHPGDGSGGDIAYAGGSQWFDESTGQRRLGAPPLGPDQKGYMQSRMAREAGSFVPGLMEAQSGNNALAALSSFMPKAQQVATERATPMVGYLDKLLSRGDIVQDGASINAATGPRLQKGRNAALDAIMMGNRVPENLYDMSNLGADIGGRQGAQNVNVRGRTPSRTRRF